MTRPRSCASWPALHPTGHGHESRHRRGRRSRPVDRPGAARERPRRLADRQGPREGQASLIEVTLPESPACVGRPVRELALPADAALVTIVRGARVIAPTPEEPLEPGDELLFVALPESEVAIREALGT